MAAVQIELVNPYFMYPGTPVHGYEDFELYNSELIRLDNTFKQVIPTIAKQKNVLFHFTIGAAMEEMAGDENIDINEQYKWMQLFPFHVQNHLKTDKNNSAILFIVSPNVILTPNFIRHTNTDYKWQKININTYVSTTYNCKVYIFTTMMPDIDIERNNYYVKTIEKLAIGQEELCLNPMKWKHSQQDINFVKNFYINLHLYKNIITANNYFTCFSFAVFRYNTINSKYNNYNMFKKLTELFVNSNENMLLAEWIWCHDNTNMKIFNSDKYISYIYISEQPQLVVINNKLIVKQ
jgi:hypothetical protein